jgi:DNA-binding response OmpR family regulator
MGNAARSALLIIEDFDEIRALLARRFTKHGFDVFSSATVRDALTIAREEAPQVIVIDYDLSPIPFEGGTGEMACHAIRRLRETLPKSHILLMGGPDTVEFKEQTQLEGASKVLTKEFKESEIDKIVNEVR